MIDPARPIPPEKLFSVVRESRALLESIEKALSAVMSDPTATPEQIQEKTNAAFRLTELTQQVLNATLEIWRAQEDLETALDQDGCKPNT